MPLHNTDEATTLKPTLHHHLPHTRHMQIVPLARRPIQKQPHPLHRLLARVAVARSVEGAFGVERVEQRRRRNGTLVA